MIRLPSSEAPDVSLIVLLDGAAEMAESCLRAVAATDDVPCETLLVLNDPDPELEQLVRGSTSGGRVILSRANAGPGVGWNLGAAVARAPRLATLHEDSEPEAGWLAPLCETMAETGAGAVGSRLFNGDGSVQNCGWVLFSDASHERIDAATAPEVVASSEPTPADMLSGAAMMVDRDAVRAAGGWDERFYPAVFMDIDVSTAMWGQGRLVLSVPESRVKHQSGAFDRRPRSALTGRWLRLFLFERNRDPFVEKWVEGVRELAAPPTGPDADAIAAAVGAAFARTRERAERVRSGAWPADRARTAERRFTGLAEPVAERGEDVYEVTAEVAEALREAERDLVDEYCRWLIVKEKETSDHLVELFEARDRAVTEQHAHIETLRRDHEELAAAFNGIVNSRTWRLRTRLLSLLGRGGGAPG